MAGCQHYVLGSTVPLGGLNFVNDLASPVSTAEMMDDFSPFFTVEFPPIQEEGFIVVFVNTAHRSGGGRFTSSFSMQSFLRRAGPGARGTISG